jgi:hypothetical protein
MGEPGAASHGVDLVSVVGVVLEDFRRDGRAGSPAHLAYRLDSEHLLAVLSTLAHRTLDRLRLGTWEAEWQAADQRSSGRH